MSSLVSFAASMNQLTNLPASFGNLNDTLRVFAAYQNRISQPLPLSLFKLSKLALFEFYANPGLTLDFDALTPTELSQVSFGSFKNVYSILLRECGLKGKLPVGMFNGVSELVVLDMASNQLTGTLPEFTGCVKLNSISFERNQLTGGVPDSWNENELPLLESINLSRNRFGIDDAGNPVSMDGIYVLPQLQKAFLSYNNISGSNAEDVGESLYNLIGNRIDEMWLDHNRISGPWSSGNDWLPSRLRVLNLAHNGVTNLPDDLWLSKFEMFDISFNNITGPLPSDAPSLSTDIVSGRRAVRQLNFEGNPYWTVAERPDWMRFTEPPKYTQSADGLYLCRGLVGNSESLTITVDPVFVNYEECLCVRGSFGVPPLCPTLPLSATLSPYTLPYSGEIGSSYIEAINSTDFKNATHYGSFNVSESYTVPFVEFPTSFSDGSENEKN